MVDFVTLHELLCLLSLQSHNCVGWVDSLMGICLFWQPAIMLCLVVFCYLIDCVCYVYVLCKIKFLLSSSVLLLDHPVLGLPMIYLLIYYIQTTLNPRNPRIVVAAILTALT